MKKVLLAVFSASLVVLLASCGTTRMYSWYNYQEDYYNYVKKSDKESMENLIKTYDMIITKQTESRGIVPPGIYADYGYLLLQSGKTKEGKAMLEKEVELYPESAVFVNSLLKRVK
nr:DUF4810 domain-containing protein [uncultured Treponema sp.]